MHIGEVARRAGLSVKTVRYYSDLGLVPEANRTMSGYRRYDTTALLRLEFVRTLRELGLDLATIRKVLERDADLTAVASAHAEALGAQIRVLRMQRAALRAIARRELTQKDIDRMNRIAQATADERRRIVGEFLDSIFSGFAIDPAKAEHARQFQARMRGASPDLPDEPTDEQVDAWLELADLVRDESFRDRLREMGRRSFGPSTSSAFPTGEAAMGLAQLVQQKAQQALDGGLAPGSAGAESIVAEVVGAFAAATGRTDSPDYRRELADAVESGHDPRAERYWQLMATINGWPSIPSAGHQWAWFIGALRA